MLRLIRPTLSMWRLSSLVSRPSTIYVRSLCSENTSPTEGELKLINILKEKFPTASLINVSDISGGCGSMYEVQMVAEEFRGKRTVLQHRMVNEALSEEIKNMHGLRISTAIPET